MITSPTSPRTLPLELWQRILFLTVPRRLTSSATSSTHNTWAAHSATLRACSLVCCDWRALAQSLLFEQAFVKGEDALVAFEAALRAYPRLAERLRVLKLYQAMQSSTVEDVLERLSGLRELYLCQIGGFDLSSLFMVPTLRTFASWGTPLTYASSPFTSLPHLTQFSLCGTALAPSVLPFFSPSVLPNLRAAAVCYSRDGGDANPRQPSYDVVARLLDAFPPSLPVLATQNPRVRYSDAKTAGRTVYTLREEAMEWYDGPIGQGARCAAIRHLQLHELGQAHLPGLLAGVGEDASLRGLRTLYLAYEAGSGKREEHERAEELEEYRRRSGVEVVFIEEREFMDDSLWSPEMLQQFGVDLEVEP
ncbi:hypothetical protein JCM8097_000445 [Rhodosporidiobolus ruineniae]